MGLLPGVKADDADGIHVGASEAAVPAGAGRPQRVARGAAAMVNLIGTMPTREALLALTEFVATRDR